MVFKIFVTVDLRHTKEGKIVPTSIMWENEDGSIEHFDVEILGEDNRASTKAGGVGRRYKVGVMGKEHYHETYLFYDTIDCLWYVENKYAPDMGGPPY